MASTQATSRTNLVSALISGLICLIIYGSMRFYADWFSSTQMTTILGGFVGSWLFVFELTAISNLEMFAFGEDFAAKLMPEVAICLIMAAVASSVIHRVCMTTCVLFSLLVLYFLDRISNEHHNKAYMRQNQQDLQYTRRSGGGGGVYGASNPTNIQQNVNIGGRRRKLN